MPAAECDLAAGCCSGGSGVACAEVEATKAKTTVINLMIASSHVNPLKEKFP